MKGNLSQFETRVNDVIATTYKSYKNDVIQAIGYLPKDKSQKRENDKQVLEEIADENLQEETR